MICGNENELARPFDRLQFKEFNEASVLSTQCPSVCQMET